MSGARRRVDLDYAVLHSTGRREPKIRGIEGNQKKTMANLDIQAVNVSSDFEDFLDSYDLDELVDEDELTEYVNKIGEIKRTFRRVFAQIKIAEGDGFAEKYPNHDNELREISVTFQEASKKLTDLRKASKATITAKEKIRDDLETEKLLEEMRSMRKLREEKRSQVIQEWKFRVDQLYWFIDECPWETKQDVDDIHHMISTLESYLSQVCKACAELKGTLGDDAKDYLDDNEKVIALARDHIRLGNA